MKKTVSRSKRLNAFQFDIGALERLVSEMAEVFPNASGRLEISIDQEGAEFNFSSLQELREHEGEISAAVVPLKVSWFSRDSDRYCLLSDVFGRAAVTAVSSSDAWCASALAVVEKHTRNNRQWYFWLRAWHVWGLAALLVPAPFVVEHIKGRTISWTSTALLQVAWLLLMVLFYFFERLFPTHTLRFKLHENWLRRWAPELTVVLTAIGVIIGIATFWYSSR